MSVAEPMSAPGTSRGAPGFAVRPAHLATLIRQVCARSHSRAVAVHVPGAWTGGDELVVDGTRWEVVRAASVLAVREALADHEAAGPDARLVILTPVEEKALGWDVLARVARQRIWTLQAWELLRDLFRARGVDPRVARRGWLADVLLEHSPATGYPPAPSGVLDLETAWTHALAVLLGMHSGAPDALTVLRWSVRQGAGARWKALAPQVRSGVRERLEETAGTLGRGLAAAVDAGNAERLLELGLVADVLWPATPPAETSLRDVLAAARVRLEPLLGGTVLTETVARSWAALSLRVLAEFQPGEADRHRRVAEMLLEELRAGEGAVLSRVLPSGAAARAVRFAHAIRQWLESGGALAPVGEAHDAFTRHTEVAGDEGRSERATMALRLVRALAAHGAPPEAGFGAAVRHHIQIASWVDGARTMLLGGDVEGALADAYRLLLRRAREHREIDTALFAERLAAWNTHPLAEPGIVPVEQVLDQIVAPIARTRPVLVILMDGMDLVTWRQLHAGLAGQGWTWWQPEAATLPPVGIATLPSVTTFSRASLFAGRLRAGSQATERSDFAAHPALRSIGGRAPVLFHKGELGSANSLSTELRDALAERQQRVVGAVINAVDDRLDRSDQVLPRWSVAAVPLLDALLQEAAAAGRAVVLLSDHGHILDHETKLRSGGEGARWRAAGGALQPGEVAVSGARVSAVTGQDSVVLAWSESLRYTGKKTGYHGGASPQETIAPIAVLSRGDLGVPEWRPMLDSAPAWWDGDAAAPSVKEVRTPVPARRPRSAPAEPALRAAPAPAPSWIGALLASPVYAAQRELAGRAAPDPERMRAVLETLDQHQGRAPRAALAAALGVPEIRVRGLIAGVRRVLNVEGFAVLEEEEATGMLALNRDLLRVQFGIG
jgi:hypothetical protein